MATLHKLVGAALITLSAMSIGVAAFNSIETNLQHIRADNSHTLVLDSSNSPVISGGIGTLTDEKGVVWEYNNVDNYNGGHITLNHQGYFGVSASTDYGFTGIEGVLANFTSDNELWLLTSADGITWGEEQILTSGESTILTNYWRYVRFYNWSNNNTSININSIRITYSCFGTSPTEDVDSAKASNVVSTSENLSYTAEYVDISPNSVGGEAVGFTKNNNNKTEIVIGFGRTYTVGKTQNAKIEFDMKTANINYGKTIQMMNGSATLGSSIDSSKCTSYKTTNIQDDWYHIEVPITTLISTISGINVNGTIKDKPHTDIEKKEFNAIKINAGTCVIDNLRISSSSCELGIFNSPTYKPTVGEFYWLKTSWVGKLYPEQVIITFSDSTMGRHIPITDPNLFKGSPFYIEWLKSGTVTITCTVISGYNRQSHTVQFTVTVN